MSITTTSEAICRLLWDAPAAAIAPDDARYGLYLDPDGPAVSHDLMGNEVRGWPVRRMDGTEQVVLVPASNGNGYTVDAEPWVKDRIGHWFTGRDGRALAALAVAQ